MSAGRWQRWIGRRLEDARRKLFRPSNGLGMMADDPRYGKYEIGAYSYGRPKVFDRGEGATLKIGKFCSIAADVKLFLGGNHPTDWATTYPLHFLFKEFSHIRGCPATKGDIVIGNDVWIGYGAILLSGVTIGDGAVVGAGAVVARNVEAYGIAAGNPAKTVKKRFDDGTIAELLRMKWWEWEIEKIKANVPLLLNENVARFLAAHREPPGRPESPAPRPE